MTPRDIPAEVATKLTNAIVRLVVTMGGVDPDKDKRGDIADARSDLHDSIQEASAAIIDEARKRAPTACGKTTFQDRFRAHGPCTHSRGHDGLCSWNDGSPAPEDGTGKKSWKRKTQED